MIASLILSIIGILISLSVRINVYLVKKTLMTPKKGDPVDKTSSEDSPKKLSEEQLPSPMEEKFWEVVHSAVSKVYLLNKDSMIGDYTRGQITEEKGNGIIKYTIKLPRIEFSISARKCMYEGDYDYHLVASALGYDNKWYYFLIDSKIGSKYWTTEMMEKDKLLQKFYLYCNELYEYSVVLNEYALVTAEFSQRISNITKLCDRELYILDHDQTN